MSAPESGSHQNGGARARTTRGTVKEHHDEAAKRAKIRNRGGSNVSATTTNAPVTLAKKHSKQSLAVALFTMEASMENANGALALERVANPEGLTFRVKRSKPGAQTAFSRWSARKSCEMPCSSWACGTWLMMLINSNGNKHSNTHTRGIACSNTAADARADARDDDAPHRSEKRSGVDCEHDKAVRCMKNGLNDRMIMVSHSRVKE